MGRAVGVKGLVEVTPSTENYRAMAAISHTWDRTGRVLGSLLYGAEHTGHSQGELYDTCHYTQCTMETAAHRRVNITRGINRLCAGMY